MKKFQNRWDWPRWGTLVLAYLLTVPLCAAAGIFLVDSVEYVTVLRGRYPELLYALPCVGLAIAGGYRLCKIPLLATLRFIVNRHNRIYYVSSWIAPLVYGTTVLSHAAGASVGCEGSSFLVGASLGSKISRTLRVNHRDVRPIICCGMASAFAPLLGTPLTAAAMILEMTPSRRIRYIIPCLGAAWCAYGLSLWTHVVPMRYTLYTVSTLGDVAWLKLGVLSFLFLAVGDGFRRLLLGFFHEIPRWIPLPYVRIFLAGVLFVVLIETTGGLDYCGTGRGVIHEALSGNARPEAFLWKMGLTILCLGSGYKGGQIVPAFFIGATLGCTAGNLLGLDPCLTAAMGFVGVFCGVVRCPLASLFLALEIFGPEAFFCFVPMAGIYFGVSLGGKNFFRKFF
ncbi:MAG: chloride channel protein [Planctomycetia bacterium]|nr:chloride channel protein [Planctomycetia bacterium]